MGVVGFDEAASFVAYVTVGVAFGVDDLAEFGVKAIVKVVHAPLGIGEALPNLCA